MHLIKNFVRLSFACALLIGSSVSATTTDNLPQESKLNFPHSFLLPRAIPTHPGSYNIQLSPFIEQYNGVSKLDVGAHIGIGMFDWGGIHFRSLGVNTTSKVEMIGMGSLLRNDSTGSGLSLLAILAVPTQRTVDSHGHDSFAFGYLLGLAGHLKPHADIAFDATVHYDFSAKHLIPEAGLVWHANERLFPTLDLVGVFGGDTELTVMPGLKYTVSTATTIGIGYRSPVTTQRTFDGQLYLQLEVGHH